MNLKEYVDKYLAYWNQADIDGLMSMYATSMLYHDMPSGEVIAYEDLKNYLNNTFSFGANLPLELKDAVFIDDKSAFIYWIQRFAAGEQDKIAQINGVELIVFSSEKIISIHEFYDYKGIGLDAPGGVDKDTTDDQMTKLGLTDELIKSIGQEITAYFDQRNPYLDPELNLTKVAAHLGYTRNQVSYVINHVLDQTFYDLVSSRRIEHVISHMSLADSNSSILEMAIGAGFNSMSGFYSAFKKQTGMSPVQYQKVNVTNKN